jgi:hypothetical protein
MRNTNPSEVPRAVMTVFRSSESFDSFDWLPVSLVARIAGVGVFEIPEGESSPKNPSSSPL